MDHIRKGYRHVQYSQKQEKRASFIHRKPADVRKVHHKGIRTDWIEIRVTYTNRRHRSNRNKNTKHAKRFERQCSKASKPNGMTSITASKKRKITCVIRGSDEDLEAVEKVRRDEFIKKRESAIASIKYHVGSTAFRGSDDTKDMITQITELEKRIQVLKEVLSRGVDVIDFDEVPDEDGMIM